MSNTCYNGIPNAVGWNAPYLYTIYLVNSNSLIMAQDKGYLLQKIIHNSLNPLY